MIGFSERKESNYTTKAVYPEIRKEYYDNAHTLKGLYFELESLSFDYDKENLKVVLLCRINELIDRQFEIHNKAKEVKLLPQPRKEHKYIGGTLKQTETGKTLKHYTNLVIQKTISLKK